MSLKEALTAGASGKAILFVGAGGTLDCTNFRYQELPTANPLLAIFNKKLGKNISNLATAAAMLADNDIFGYYNTIRDTFTVQTVPQSLTDLLKFPWQKVYTTNYDNALEIAARNAGKQIRSLTQYERPEREISILPIVHLHGFVERFTVENVRKDCILDFMSNVANDVYTGSWGTQIKNDIANADLVIFLGYSLYDPEIPKLLRAAETSHDRILFINSHQENEELNYRQKQFGHPLQIDRDGLIRVCESAQKHSRRSLRESYTCFDLPNATYPSAKAPGQQRLENHFLYGNRDHEFLAKDIRDKTEAYIITQDVVLEVIKELSSHRFITIYANLGYGKTVAARSILERARSDLNRPAFLMKKDQPELRDEFDYICENYADPLIIIEDIAKYARHWAHFSIKLPSAGAIVATSRFNIFEHHQSEIDATFMDLSPFHIRIDKFSDRERSSLTPLISQASLWGDNSHLNNHQKANLIATKYKNNFADLLIGLMNSSDLIGRYKRELSILKELAPDAYKGVLLCIYLEFIDAHPDEVMLKDTFGKEIKEVSERQDVSDLVRSFVLSDRAGTLYSSSIFSKFAIETICDREDLATVIEEALVYLVDGPSISGDLFHVSRELMRFNYLKSLARDGNFDRVADIYDHVSRLSALHEHDLFWLQYGMLERARHNFPKARRHLVESRGYARKKGSTYIPYQTENQLAACILENGIYEELRIEDAFRDANEISDILERQIDEARVSYSDQPFQWHDQIDDFMSRWLERIPPEQRKVILAKLKRYRDLITQKIRGWERRQKGKRTIDVIEKYLTKFTYPFSTQK
jgi:hypothetical protein